MVKLNKMKLVNFIGIYIGTGEKVFEFDRTNSTNNIIFIIGDNGSGKTTVLSEMTPLPLEHIGSRGKSRIIPGEIGIKELEYVVDNIYKYNIKIVYDTNKKTTKCFIRKIVGDIDQELNPSGNVESYLEVALPELGMKKQYLNIGYLSKHIKNFVSMKPTERNNYISEWMPEISEFLNAYRLTSKLLNKIKKDIDNYNKDIGKISSVNYELELNFINSNITNITGNIEKINNDIVELSTYQSQIKKLVRTKQELSDMKDQIYKDARKFKSMCEEFENKYSILKKINIGSSTNDESERFFEDLKNKKNNIESDINRVEDELFLLQNEIESNKLLLNLTGDTVIDMDLTTIYDNIDSKKELLISVDQQITQFLNIYTGGEDSLKSKESTLSHFKSILQIIESMFIRLNNMISIDYINNMESVESLLKDKELLLTQLTDTSKDFETKLTKCNNEIYKYENGNIDSEILMKRPEFCKTSNCGIVDELMKYLDPKESINEMYNTSNDLQKQIFDNNRNIEKIKEEIEDIKKACVLYVEIGDFIHKNDEIIANLPPVLYDFFLNDTITIFTYINKIKGILADSLEFSSLIEKKQELVKTISELENVKSIICANSKIEEKLNMTVIKYEESKIYKSELFKSLSEINELLEIYKNRVKLLKERNIEIAIINDYNDRYRLNCKNSMIFVKNFYVYHSNESRITELEKKKMELQVELSKLNSKRDEMSTFYISKRQIEKMRNELQEEFNNINVLNKIWSPKVGYPSWIIESYLNDLTVKTNNDLSEMWGSSLRIENFLIGENDFSIVVNRNGTQIEDASLCSDGETVTLNLAISFAMIELNIDKCGYDVIRLDEVDGTLDDKRRQMFAKMVNDRIDKIGCDTCAIISHNDEFEDISCDMLLFKGSNIPEEKLKNKNVIFRASE